MRKTLRIVLLNCVLRNNYDKCLLVYGDITQLLQVVYLSSINRDSLRHVVVICRVHRQYQLTIGVQS